MNDEGSKERSTSNNLHMLLKIVHEENGNSLNIHGCNVGRKPHPKSLLKTSTSFVESTDNFVKRKVSFSDQNGQSLTEVRFIVDILKLQESKAHKHIVLKKQSASLSTQGRR